MAVAGSGGWIPSVSITSTDGKLKPVGITHNVPRHLVFSEHYDPRVKQRWDELPPEKKENKDEPHFAGTLFMACIHIICGRTVHVDTRGTQLGNLAAIHNQLNTHPSGTLLRAMAKAGIEPNIIESAWETMRYTATITANDPNRQRSIRKVLHGFGSPTDNSNEWKLYLNEKQHTNLQQIYAAELQLTKDEHE